MAEKYDDNSIKALKGSERVRYRPGVMFGSDDINGAFHTVTEVVANSLDESRAGHGKKIIVTYHKDGSISVKDEGRGVPMAYNEAEGRYNWDLIFNELYAGGKYADGSEEWDSITIDDLVKLGWAMMGGNESQESEVAMGYKFPLGLNGLGSAATQYTSEWMNVTSWRPEKIYKMQFEKGSPVGELHQEDNTEGTTGTLVHWKIDNEVFPNTKFNNLMFTQQLEGQAHLNNVEILFIDEMMGKETVFQGGGLGNFLTEKVGDSIIDSFLKVSADKGTEQGKKYLAMGQFVLAITEETTSRQLHYHNTGPMRVGVHANAFNDAVTAFFKRIAKQNDVNILPVDYQDYLSFLSSTYSTITSFANQTKDGVSNRFIYNLIYNGVLDILEEAVAKQRESVTTLISNVVNAAIARKRAKEFEQQARQAAKMVGKKREKAAKYIDCQSDDRNKKELFIVEGDSAAGSCKKARDSNFQAILPIKGKPINALKNKLSKILENEEVKAIVTTIGTGVDIAGTDTFDIENIQFKRIIITTDADVDGYQIRVLLYTIFYRLMPRLLEEDFIFIAETPLFELITNKGTFFAYNVKEYNDFLEEFKGNGTIVQKINRSKGLGQNNPEMLGMTTMHPDTRRLVPLKMSLGDTMVREITNMLFGTDTENARKGFILSLLEDKMGMDAGINEMLETAEALVGLDVFEEEEETANVAG